MLKGTRIGLVLCLGSLSPRISTALGAGPPRRALSMNAEQSRHRAEIRPFIQSKAAPIDRHSPRSGSIAPSDIGCGFFGHSVLKCHNYRSEHNQSGPSASRRDLHGGNGSFCRDHRNRGCHPDQNLGPVVFGTTWFRIPRVASGRFRSGIQRQTVEVWQ